MKDPTNPTDKELDDIGLTREQYEEELEVISTFMNETAELYYDLKEKEYSDEQMSNLMNEFSLIRYHAELYARWLEGDLGFMLNDENQFTVVGFTNECSNCKEENKSKDDQMVVSENNLIDFSRYVKNSNKTLN